MSNKMVILQVLPALEMGGVERGTIEISAALQKKKIENYVVSSGGPMVHSLDEIGVEHITLPVHSKNPLTILRNISRLIKVIRDKKITLIHVRSRAPAWSVKYASKKTGVPFIATYHGVYGIEPALFKKPYNRIMTTGKRIIAVSQFVKNHIIKNYQVPANQIRVIHRGADVQKFDPKKTSSKAVQTLAKKYGISLSKPIITLVGRLTRWKGQLDLLEALKNIDNKKVTCLFVGSDQGRTDYTAEMKKKIKELDPKTEVKIIPSCSEMPTLYALSDIVLCPSRDPEAFGRVVTEAQAMGRVVIASRHGGACETIQDGKTGFLFTPCNVRDLTKVLNKVLKLTSEEKKKLGKASIISVHKNFSVEAMCQKTIQLYQEILR